MKSSFDKQFGDLTDAKQHIKQGVRIKLTTSKKSMKPRFLVPLLSAVFLVGVVAFLISQSQNNTSQSQMTSAVNINPHLNETYYDTIFFQRYYYDGRFTTKEQVIDETINDMIQAKAYIYYGKQKGIEIPNKEIRKLYEDFLRGYGAPNGYTSYQIESMLQSLHIDVETYKKLVVENNLVGGLYKEKLTLILNKENGEPLAEELILAEAWNAYYEKYKEEVDAFIDSTSFAEIENNQTLEMNTIETVDRTREIGIDVKDDLEKFEEPTNAAADIQATYANELLYILKKYDLTYLCLGSLSEYLNALSKEDGQRYIELALLLQVLKNSFE
jgi:hypothetical protein